MFLLKNLKLKLTILVILLILGMVSCSKKPDDVADNQVQEADMEEISSEDFTEHDEDLLSVDYKEFYDELAPHGEWIEVKAEDIGVELKKGSASGKSHRTISFSDFFGVKEANADAGFGAFFVWQPAPNLAVGVVAGETPQYVPYTNGQWINTDAGWYFRAASEPEEITHHYGRWVHSPSVGWVWVPGRVWAPAWVDWRIQDDYIAWTPVPPSYYIVNNTIITPPVYEERYVVVERRYFVEPVIYTHIITETPFVVTTWTRPEGIVVVNNTVINRGPEVMVIQNVIGAPIPVVTVSHVKTKSKVIYTSSQFNVYTPDFKKVKIKNKITKTTVTSPHNYVSYENAVVKNKVGKQDRENSRGKENSGGQKFDEKGKLKKEYIDDRNMKDGGKNRNQDIKKSDDNSRKNKNSGNDNNYNRKDKNSGNDNNVKKNKENRNPKKDNGSRNDGKKDNGKKDNNVKKDNSKKDGSGNDKGKKNYRNDGGKQNDSQKDKQGSNKENQNSSKDKSGRKNK